MINIITIIVSSLLTNNIVFSQTLGMCPFLGVSKKTNSAVGMGLAVTFVILISSLIAWVLNVFLLEKLDLVYLQVIVYILVIACLVQLLDIALKKVAPSLYNALGIYLALITTNCAVLGTAINVTSVRITSLAASLVETFVVALFTGLGFLVALVFMAGVRERMETANIPRFFKGFPITLIAAAIMALAFMGFASFSFELPF